MLRMTRLAGSASSSSCDPDLPYRSGTRRKMQEHAMKDEEPVVAYDRRLPKNARSKQHLLSRIHTIESTLQRLYGKLDADSELPEVEDIEQIMAATIKQTAHEPDQGAAEDQLKPPALQPPPQVSFAEKTPAREGDDEGLDQAKAVSDVERRQMLRTESRKRMADREAARGVTRGGVTFADAPSFDDTAATTDTCEEEISEDAEANLLSRTAPGRSWDQGQGKYAQR
eukprot:Tamp_04574.p1 GENE.Tamp_04574~~Tamp_04574.p1  ORF type:complete len:227 (+),score=45.05 Tamp_04574:2522-3202(+)